MMDFGSLIGKNIALNGERPPLSPCSYCGGIEGNIRPGKGPHLAGVRCNECDTHLGWLSGEWLSYLLSEGANA